jgi:hypothetical protein
LPIPPIPAYSEKGGYPLTDGTQSTYTIPMSEILTPMQFSLAQFRRNFSFEPTDSHTWDWRASIRRDHVPSSCAGMLTKGKPGGTPVDKGQAAHDGHSLPDTGKPPKLEPVE